MHDPEGKKKCMQLDESGELAVLLLCKVTFFAFTVQLLLCNSFSHYMTAVVEY